MRRWKTSAWSTHINMIYINVSKRKSCAFLVWELNGPLRYLLINMYDRTFLSTRCSRHVSFPRAVLYFLHTAEATSPYTSTLLHQPPPSAPWWGIIIRLQSLNVHRQTPTHQLSSSEWSQNPNISLCTQHWVRHAWCDKVWCWQRATSRAYVPSSHSRCFLSVIDRQTSFLSNYFKIYTAQRVELRHTDKQTQSPSKETEFHITSNHYLTIHLWNHL